MDVCLIEFLQDLVRSLDVLWVLLLKRGNAQAAHFLVALTLVACIATFFSLERSCTATILWTFVLAVTGLVATP